VREFPVEPVSETLLDQFIKTIPSPPKTKVEEAAVAIAKELKHARGLLRRFRIQQGSGERPGMHQCLVKPTHGYECDVCLLLDSYIHKMIEANKPVEKVETKQEPDPCCKVTYTEPVTDDEAKKVVEMAVQHIKAAALPNFGQLEVLGCSNPSCAAVFDLAQDTEARTQLVGFPCDKCGNPIRIRPLEITTMQDYIHE